MPSSPATTILAPTPAKQVVRDTCFVGTLEGICPSEAGAIAGRMTMRLRDVRVAALLADEFEDEELAAPVRAMESEGAEVILIGLDEHSKMGMVGKRGTVVAADATVDEVSAEEFAAVLIPGGHSPDHLADDERMRRFVREAAGADRMIAAICHGPRLLVASGVSGGRIMTSHPSVGPELEATGAVYVDQAVAIDGQFLTARRPEDLPEFTDAMLKMMEHRAQRAA
jgi:protease I